MSETTNISNGRKHRYHSLFWPFVLIGAGVIWLLVNLGLVSSAGLAMLWRLWPIMLIVIGLDILIGRRSYVVGALIGILTVGSVVALLILAPALGYTNEDDARFFGMPVVFLGAEDVKTERFSEPLEGVESAQVTLDLSSATTKVHSLSDASLLFDAELTHFGEIDYRATGESQKTIFLGQSEAVNIGTVDWWAGEKLRWNVGLNPEVPTDLRIDVGSGSADLALDELTLTGLSVDGGSGSTSLSLPGGEEYSMDLESHSGAFTASLPADADVKMRVNSASGSFSLKIDEGSRVNLVAHSGSGHLSVSVGQDTEMTLELSTASGGASLDLPAGAAMRVEVRDSGSGNVRFPSALHQIEGGNENDEDNGVWETDGYSDAVRKITIIVNELGSGSIVVR